MRRHLPLIGIVSVALVLAWLARFACDDAFISYVYSRNLIFGDGLTWFGAHVEGYTNFAWVLWVAAGLELGIDPVVWSWVGSLAALALAVIVTYRIARLRTSSDVAALAAAGLIATNYTFAAFGTSGLETMLQCALLAGAWFEVERLRRAEEPPSVRRVALLSLLAAFALWTRLDSAVYLVVIGIAAVPPLVRAKDRKLWLAALVPALVLVGGWLAWKLSYYGDVLPNTFHAKVDVSTRTLASAGSFTWAFVREYALYVPLVAMVVVAVVRRRLAARLPLAIVLAWIAYVIVTGGDFMEFRFFVPVMPPLFVAIAETLVVDGPARVKPWLRALVLVVFTGAFSARHAVTWQGAANNSVDSVHMLATYYGLLPREDWASLGTPLGDVLHDTGASIACNGAGAIPYYADIPTIDQLGLNDPWIARNGARPPAKYTRPGHQRFATIEYLERRNVTFVIGTPRLVERGILTDIGMTVGIQQWLSAVMYPAGFPVDKALIVAVPVGHGLSMLMWYRQPTPEITQRIRAAGWEIRAFDRAH